MKRITLFPFVFFCLTALFFPFRLIQTLSLFIIFLYIFSLVISLWSYFSIDAIREKNIYYCKHGHDESTSFTVTNKSFFPLFNIIIRDRGAGIYEQDAGSFIDTIGPSTGKNYSCKLKTEPRGHHKIGPIIIKGSDPFRLFPWTKIIHKYANVVIYPRFFPLHLILKEGEVGGSQKVKNLLYEDFTELKSIRDYRMGDPIKRINWKASARSGILQTMEFFNTLSAPVFILLDLNAREYPMKRRYTRLERAIEAAASLVVSYHNNKENFGLLSNGLSKSILIPLSKSYQHMVSILDHLAQINFKDQNKDPIIYNFLQYQLNLPIGTHFYILTPNITPEKNKQIELLKKKKYKIKVVNTGGEIVLRPPEFCDYYMLTEYGGSYFHERK